MTTRQNLHYQKNKEHHAEVMKAARARDPERYREYDRKKYARYRAKHKEKVAAYRKEYRKRNYTQVLIWNETYRDRVRGNEQEFSISDWDNVQDVFGRRCAYCDRNQKLSMDHFIPVTKSGGTVVGNIIPACKSCNSTKHNKHPKSWLGEKRYKELVDILHSLRLET